MVPLWHHQLLQLSPSPCVFSLSALTGPRLDMDPDIVAALDEDFDYGDPENILEDDFIVKATSADEAVDAE